MKSLYLHLDMLSPWHSVDRKSYDLFMLTRSSSSHLDVVSMAFYLYKVIWSIHAHEEFFLTFGHCLHGILSLGGHLIYSCSRGVLPHIWTLSPWHSVSRRSSDLFMLRGVLPHIWTMSPWHSVSRRSSDLFMLTRSSSSHLNDVSMAFYLYKVIWSIHAHEEFFLTFGRCLHGILSLQGHLIYSWSRGVLPHIWTLSPWHSVSRRSSDLFILRGVLPHIWTLSPWHSVSRRSSDLFMLRGVLPHIWTLSPWHSISMRSSDLFMVTRSSSSYLDVVSMAFYLYEVIWSIHGHEEFFLTFGRCLHGILSLRGCRRQQHTTAIRVIIITATLTRGPAYSRFTAWTRQGWYLWTNISNEMF